MQLTGLKEETEYTFYITAQNEAGDSEKSEGVTLKTKKPGIIQTYFSQKYTRIIINTNLQYYIP